MGGGEAMMNSKYVFDGFMDVPPLSDGIIRLVCKAKNPGIPEKGWVPCYDFDICHGSEKVGEIRLRIGYTDGLYYSGQIGYEVNEAHRGKGYAVRACRLLAPAARYHDMEKLLITNEEGNLASYRVCEKLGAKFVRKAELPSWHDMYEAGHRYMNIFEWDLRSDEEN
jgi:tagatose 1,6-diphosphate aldolase